VVIRLAVPLALVAAPAVAQDSVSIGRSGYTNPTTVTLQDSAHPQAVAEIVFHNAPVNGPSNNGDYHLSHNGIEVTVTFTWNMMGDDDGIEIAVPDGFIAVPPVLAVPEGSTGTVLIFSNEGVTG
jgi:hypothetical protein